MDVRLQLIYSHSFECTRIPWGSLTSLVISLALVNGIHYWPIIKWFLPCSTSTSLITCIESYPFLGSGWRPWDHVLYPGCNGDCPHYCNVTQIHFVLVVVVLLFHHGSTLYFRVHDFSMVILGTYWHCMSVFVSSFSTFMDLQCIGWQRCCESLGW